MFLSEIPNKAIRLVTGFFDKLGLKTRFNSFYNAKQIGKQILYSAIKEISAEATSKLMKIEFVSSSVASADVVLEHLHLLSCGQMESRMRESIVKAREYAKQYYKEPVTIAFDLHDKPYYGDHNNTHVVGTKNKAGTNYALRYITAEIVEHGKRLCIFCEPMYCGAELPEVFARALSQAKRVVKIKLVLVDRGFYNVECIRAIKTALLRFIMPVIRDSKMKKFMQEKSLELPWAGNYTIRENNDGESFTLCAKWEGDEIYGFATNIPYEGCTKDEMKKFVEEIAASYDARWGIETGYRVKNDFLAKTTSTNHKIRQLYFFLSVILFNAWVLAKQLLEIPLRGYVFKHLLIRELIQPEYASHPP